MFSFFFFCSPWFTGDPWKKNKSKANADSRRRNYTDARIRLCSTSRPCLLTRTNDKISFATHVKRGEARDHIPTFWQTKLLTIEEGRALCHIQFLSQETCHNNNQTHIFLLFLFLITSLDVHYNKNRQSEHQQRLQEVHCWRIVGSKKRWLNYKNRCLKLRHNSTWFSRPTDKQHVKNKYQEAPHQITSPSIFTKLHKQERGRPNKVTP